MTLERLVPQLCTAEGVLGFPPHPRNVGVPRRPANPIAAFYSAAPGSPPLTSQPTHREDGARVGEQRHGLKSTAVKESEDQGEPGK